MENPVIIIGAKGIGKVALDIFQNNGVEVYCLLDDDKGLHEKEISGVTIMGASDDTTYLKLLGKKCGVFVASDDGKWKKSVVEDLVEERKVMPVNAIHQTVVFSKTSTLGHGNLIQAGVIVGPEVKLGSHTIIGTQCSIDFEAEIEDFVQLGAGVKIGSSVKIGKGAFIGTGAVVVSGIKIGKNARIGAGSVVIADVKDAETVFGNPASKVK